MWLAVGSTVVTLVCVDTLWSKNLPRRTAQDHEATMAAPRTVMCHGRTGHTARTDTVGSHGP